MVVLFGPGAAPESSEALMAGGIELAGIVFDAKLVNGDWPIVGRMVPVAVAKPWFVVGHRDLGDLRLTDFERSTTRLVSESEASKHLNRTLSYPMVLEDAAAAARGQAPWRQEYNRFRALAMELTVKG